MHSAQAVNTVPMVQHRPSCGCFGGEKFCNGCSSVGGRANDSLMLWEALEMSWEVSRESVFRGRRLKKNYWINGYRHGFDSALQR